MERSSEAETLGMAQASGFHHPSSWCWVSLKLKNHFHAAWYSLNVFLVEVYFKRHYKGFFFNYTLQTHLSNIQGQSSEHIIADTLNFIYKISLTYCFAPACLLSYLIKYSQGPCTCMNDWLCCFGRRQSYFPSCFLSPSVLMSLPHPFRSHQCSAQPLAHHRQLIIINEIIC